MSSSTICFSVNGYACFEIQRKITNSFSYIRYFLRNFAVENGFFSMKLTKNRFLMGFVAVVAVLAVVRVLFPAIAMPSTAVEQETETLTSNLPPVVEDRVLVVDAPHRIFSVANYQAAFPDSNSVQLVAAHRNGVSPVKNREDAEMRKKELVFVGSNPYYHVDRLTSSIPYLVPRAAVLLQDIGRAFYDSLYVKGVPLHQLIVTSVLRSEDDVRRLRLRNGNATENSCHLYGTTFDICYNRYRTVEDPDGPARRAVRNDTLKWVLSEVLRDFRQQERCYIKYEVKQGCFHLTVN